MKETKCPKCGHVQNKQNQKPDLETKLFMDFFGSQGTKFVHHIQCEKCEVFFPQDEHTVENPMHKIAQKFVDKYFNYDVEDEEDKIILTVDDWIDGEGGIVDVHGYCFYIEFMKEALKLNATQDQVLDFYNYEIDSFTNGKQPMTFQEFINKNEL